MTSFFRDEKGGSERLSYCPKSHSQSGKSWGATPGLLAPPLLRPLLSPRPRPLRNLLLLLWTLLNCGLGVNAQVKGDMSPGGSGYGNPAGSVGVTRLLSRLTLPLSPQVGSG